MKKAPRRCQALEFRYKNAFRQQLLDGYNELFIVHFVAHTNFS